MNGGYIKLYRKINESFKKNEKYCSRMAWVDLLLNANWKDDFFYVRDVKVEIHRGQVGWSEYQLAARWKWSRGRVRRFLIELQNEQRIVLQHSPVTSIITITNYEMYQGDGTTESTTDDTTGGTTGGTTDGTQIKKIKKEQIKKRNKNTYADDPLFEKFWEEYPIRPSSGKKGNKSDALKIWANLVNGEKEKAVSALSLYLQTKSWMDGYSPDAERYLRKKMFLEPPLLNIKPTNEFVPGTAKFTNCWTIDDDGKEVWVNEKGEYEYPNQEGT